MARSHPPLLLHEAISVRHAVSAAKEAHVQPALRHHAIIGPEINVRRQARGNLAGRPLSRVDE